MGEYSKKEDDDPQYYIYRAVKSICSKENRYYSTKITADLLIKEAETTWALELSRRICPKPKNDKEKQRSLDLATKKIEEKGIRWHRELDDCGLGVDDGIKPRKAGRKKGAKNALPTKEGRR
jgi:hypothetical protein